MLRTLHHFLSRAADMKPALSVVIGGAPDRAATMGLGLSGESQRDAA